MHTYYKGYKKDKCIYIYIFICKKKAPGIPGKLLYSKIKGGGEMTQQRHKHNLSLQASTNVIITKQNEIQQNKSETFEISL